jgi:protein-tyrosine phosphatase
MGCGAHAALPKVSSLVSRIVVKMGTTKHQPESGKLLFLCTGNYYRSRFAEELFNHLASGNGLNWTASSRGLATERGVRNVGPISPHAVQGLAARGIHLDGSIRPPLQLSEDDLQRADLIIALKEMEHRPLVAERFPIWSNRVEYWNIDDLDKATPEEALPEIEGRIRELICNFT